MNRNQYWLLSICIVSFTMLLGACNKSSTSTTTDTNSGNWIKATQFNGDVRAGAVAFTIGDTAYVGLGYNGTERVSDFYKYDVNAKTWRNMAAFPGTTRSSAIAFSVNGKGYVASGLDQANTYLNDVWEYDPATNAWTQKNNFPFSKRAEAVGFAIGNYGYLSCGFNNSNLKDTWQYDPATDTWTEIDGFEGDKRRGAVAFVHDNAAYLLTGYSNGEGVTDFYKFSPDGAVGNKWKKLRSITNLPDSSYNSDYKDIIRQYAVAFTVGAGADAKAYVATGDNNGNLNDKTWEYNFQKDTWSRKTNFESSLRTRAVAFTVKNRGFVGLGMSNGLYFDNFFEFLPNQSKAEND